MYDGGKSSTGTSINDIFYDVKCLTNSVYVCVGVSGDSSNSAQSIFTKLGADGKILQKKLFTTKNTVNAFYNMQTMHSIFVAKNGDFILGGDRFAGPLAMRLDSLGNIKWATWYYDSTKGVSGSFLQGGGTINSLRETSRGTIICAVGDEYPNNNGLTLSNYAALIEFDSTGRNPYLPDEPCFVAGEFYKEAGYKISGFFVDETKGNNLVLSGNQSVYYTDSLGNPKWRKNYTFSLNGVGTVTNNVARAKVLRDNSLMVAGQAYEGNCWTREKRLIYDAWWSPVDFGSGSNTAWDTAGIQGANDKIVNFTQLNNGNLVFIGTKGDYTNNFRTWFIVTDSTGKKIYMDKEMFLCDSVRYSTQAPMAITEAPDGGFTITGYVLNRTTGGKDAFVTHFIPKTVSAVVSRSNSLSKSVNGFSVHVAGAKLIVSSAISAMARSEVALFDVSGKRVFNTTSPRPLATPLPQARGKTNFTIIQFDISKLAHGTYFVRMKAGAAVETTKFAY